MGVNTNSSSAAHEKEQNIPVWARPVLRACGSLQKPFLVLACLLLVAHFLLLIFGRIGFPWLPNVTKGMVFLTLMGYIFLLITSYAEPSAGVFGVILGTAFFKGSIFLVNFILQQNGLADRLAKMPAENSFVTLFTDQLSQLGLTLAILSIIQLLFVFVLKAITSRGQARYNTIKYLDTSDQDAKKRDIFPKCWQMSRCRPIVRPLCPNYIDRISCWKRRGGCFCHRELGNYLKDAVERQNAAEEMTTESMREGKRLMTAITDRLKKTRPKWRDQKGRCFSCPLYEEHEEYKYRNLTWVNFPLSVVIVLAIYYPYDWLYNWGMTYVDEWVQAMMTKYPFLQQATQATSLAHSPFEWVVLGVIALTLLSYVMAFTETFFLKWKM